MKTEGIAYVSCVQTYARQDLTNLQDSDLAHTLKQIASSLSAAPSSQAQTSEQVGFVIVCMMPSSADKFDRALLCTV